MPSLLLLSFLGLSISIQPAAVAAEPTRPMAEMHGGCADFKTPLNQEFKDWELGASPLATNEGKKNTLLPLNKRLRLVLEPAAKVAYPRAPEKGAKEGYGAAMPLRVANSGTYKVAAGAKAWLEISAKGTRVPEEKFEMQTKCESIRKVVTFKLDGGQDYILSVSRAPEANLDVMISKQL